MDFGSPLSSDLRAKYNRRSAHPREGDTVRIVRGEFKGIEGKVTKVVADGGKLNVEGVTREKIEGGTAPVMIDSSKVVITNLDLDDKKRKTKIGGE